ncbi:MAG TPA: resolvase [Oscillatoriaceae cyanobacterium M33_DOE_052]|uniref:Resolvase n=1 Tax=Planktothricoides sp. SpSt-374 TaxID=2282167 RepID=A0A7C3VPF9_9CYAN|nr:resolvase [Oscillatoriaceae cyanobacterium M33_DOE_052]
MILGFDPGKVKCGIAVMGEDGKILHHQVVPSAEAVATLKSLAAQYAISILVMGDRTTAKQWKQQLLDSGWQSDQIAMVNEGYSTLAARERYWQMYPPQGLWRLVPQGMREPPRPVDDIVAIILIERYLGIKSGD